MKIGDNEEVDLRVYFTWNLERAYIMADTLRD